MYTHIIHIHSIHTRKYLSCWLGPPPLGPPQKAPAGGLTTRGTTAAAAAAAKAATPPATTAASSARPTLESLAESHVGSVFVIVLYAQILCLSSIARRPCIVHPCNWFLL